MEEQVFFEEWPTISFDEIEKEGEEGAAGVFYRSFFRLLHLPEVVLSSFVGLFKAL